MASVGFDDDDDDADDGFWARAGRCARRATRRATASGRVESSSR
jgi:hypothetical protein